MEFDKETNQIFQWQWDPRGKLALLVSRKLKAQSNRFGSDCKQENNKPNWNLSDLLLAARILEKDASVSYENESQMRRVFNLIYDILRFNPILSQAFEDVRFWQRYEELKTRRTTVFLLFYDMQVRKFVGQTQYTEVSERYRALNEAGIFNIQKALNSMKTRLYASMAKIKINGKALQFDDLLPRHLRMSDRILCTSGWVNTMKIASQHDFISEMSKIGFSVCYECSINDLHGNLFNFDPLCPKIVNFHQEAREQLADSNLVREFRFIFLDRTLCFGAAALCHAIRVEELRGPVIMTHAVAPCYVAYLSNLLSDIVHAGRLLVFGTGFNRRLYENCLHNLGITLQRCQIFSENYIDLNSSPESDRATAVLATPASSYTGVTDIVDFVIAKGGNVKILESLTEFDAANISEDIVADQISTLQYSLQKPNMKLVIYEVHSVLHQETVQVVDQVVQHANRVAHENFTALNTKRKVTVDANEIPNSVLYTSLNISDIYQDKSVNDIIPDGCFLSVFKRISLEPMASISQDNKRTDLLKGHQKIQKRSLRQKVLMNRMSVNSKKKSSSEICTNNKKQTKSYSIEEKL